MFQNPLRSMLTALGLSGPRAFCFSGVFRLDLVEKTMSAPASPTNRLIIFDTTLRDGEQSPGASMNLAEKVEVALALKELGVDVIEAGFPIASPGDFEAVQAIARDVKGPAFFGLARGHNARNDPAL